MKPFVVGRVNLLPFNVTIKHEDRDKNLTEKLTVEWPGILAWMIDGCLEWQRKGLQAPKMYEATDNYLETEDRLGRWVAECCVPDPKGWTSSTDLFVSWSDWAHTNGEFVGSLTKFSKDLKDAGFKDRRTPKANGFDGLILLSSPSSGFDEFSRRRA